MNEQLENILLAKDIPATAMRLLVLDYLLRQSTAVDLPQLEQGFHHADRTTLYRTLKTFEEKGLIHCIKDGTSATKYAVCAEACKTGEHYDLHFHFNCTRCGQTFCLPRTKIPEVVLPANFSLNELSLIAKGICDQCSRKQCN